MKLCQNTMGACFARFRRPSRNITVAVLGLDCAGKTATVKRLLGENVDGTVPTIGFISQEIKFDGHTITIFDLGGGERIRNIWKNYYADLHGLIFVIDSSEEERFEEAQVALKAVLQHEKMVKKPYLVLANKQDKESAASVEEITERLQLEDAVRGKKHETLVVGSMAVSNDSKALKEGFKWLVDQICGRFSEIDERVQKDKKEQEEIRRKEDEAKKERVRLIRAQREADEAAERAARGETEPAEDDLDPGDTGDPFRRVDASQFANEAPAAKKDNKRTAGVPAAAAVPEVNQQQQQQQQKSEDVMKTTAVKNSMASVDSAIVTSRPTSADDDARTARSVDVNDGGAASNASFSRDGKNDDEGGQSLSSDLPQKKRGTLIPLGPLPPLQSAAVAERAKRKQRRAKRNQISPVPANGHASRPLSTGNERVRPHNADMSDLFKTDEQHDNPTFQPDDDQQRDMKFAAGDQPMSSSMAVSTGSIRNPNIETLGELLTDDESDSDDNYESLQVNATASHRGDSDGRRPQQHFASVSPRDHVAKYIVDPMSLEPVTPRRASDE